MRECERCIRNNVVDLKYCTNCGYDRSQETKWKAVLNFNSGEWADNPIYLTTSTLIGRSQELDIPLMADRSVSRLHATIKGVGNLWTIYDNGSENGVLVNDKRINVNVRLQDGDSITIGTATVVFHIL